MTTKQMIASAKKQKDINLIILAYNKYYQEQRDKEASQRIKEIQSLSERMQKIILANILRRKFLGITRETANEIIKYFFKPIHKKQSFYSWSNTYYSIYNAKDVLNEVVL